MNREIAKKILLENKKNYDLIASEFDRTRFFNWPEIEKITRDLVKKGDNVLDLGCGNGRLYKILQKFDIDYIGIDNSTNLINLAEHNFNHNKNNLWKSDSRRLNNFPTNLGKTNIRRSDLRILKFVVADALDFQMPGSFDKIFSLAVLPHIPSLELRNLFLQNCWQNLKKDGLLILSAWNLWQPKTVMKYKLWHLLWNGKLADMDRRDTLIPWYLKNGKKVWRYYHAFTKKELIRLLKKNNFEIVDCFYARKGEHTNILNGYNLICIAKKRSVG